MYRNKISCSLIISIFLWIFLLNSCKKETVSQRNSNFKITEDFKNQLTSIDQMMDKGFFDSAQIHLNLLKDENSFHQPNLTSYLISSRQSEIYYFNNLHVIGIQEAKKALNIAKVLKDSSLLLDAYNFCGLFYTNMDSMNNAINNFYNGLKYSPTNISESVQDILLSRPFHIYGNLAEAYFKENQLDSSIFYNKLTQKEAIIDKNKRGEIISLLQLGDAYFKKGNIDSAEIYFEQAHLFSNQNQLFDLALNSLGNLAETKSDQPTLSNKILNEGFQLQKEHPEINSYYKILFLNKASEIYSQQNDFEQLSLVLKQLTVDQAKTKDISNKQYLNVFMTGLQNESKLLNLEIEKANQAQKIANNRMYIILLVVLVLIIFFFAYRYYAQQKLKMSELRNEISQDLHDEVGSTLSGIAMYSYIIKNQIKAGDENVVNESLQVIEKNATEMVKKLSDIVWSVNPLYDDLGQLIIRLYDFAIELAQVKEIQVHLNIPPELEKIKLPMIHRKNLYLICKEAINNAVKHSDCNNIFIQVTKDHSFLNITVQDDGKGIAHNKVIKGNGLDNMSKRAVEMKADLVKNFEQNGVKIQIKFKIT